MEIEFSVPNGKMRINAEAFFGSAGRRQIRRMLKCLVESGQGAEKAEGIKAWLEREVREAAEGVGRDARARESHRADLAELEELYGQMSRAARDKSPLSEVREGMRRSRAKAAAAGKAVETATRRIRRYGGVLADVDRLFPERDGSGGEGDGR